MGRKKYRPNIRFYLIITILIISVFSIIKLSSKEKSEKNSISNEKKEISKEKKINTEIKDLENFAIITDDKIYYIYKKEFVLEMPDNLKLNKTYEIKDILNKKNYLEAINLINVILPESIKNYKRKEVKFSSDYEIYELPTLEINQNTYIDSYKTNQLFSQEYYNISKERNKNITLDILNANGISGYAGKTGKKLEDKLGYNYNAANYKTHENYSYVINKSLSKKELEDIALTLSEKNIKIKEDISLTTLSDAVIILGKDRGDLIYIMFKRYNKLDYENYNILKKSGYEDLHRISIDTKINQNKIEYNPEDYYTAFKIGEKLDIQKLFENKDLKNRIDIYIKN
ncbi:MAG: LytR C-terminal domain-containing protein [Fusobacteriota bacterium]